ncbi:hypothetical protein jhhlp_007277 [Lomentospora prolificans]|uniref:DUF8004 domain-containing protein n=1 Tax=Lomentospora prolificans TaxID=41688 RepID=A0A2N3N274_9PEZI|nr:hypothetical protein jhhlp_007277 [Lomentospora prolificans]
MTSDPLRTHTIKRKPIPRRDSSSTAASTASRSNSIGQADYIALDLPENSQVPPAEEQHLVPVPEVTSLPPAPVPPKEERPLSSTSFSNAFDRDLDTMTDSAVADRRSMLRLPSPMPPFLSKSSLGFKKEPSPPPLPPVDTKLEGNLQKPQPPFQFPERRRGSSLQGRAPAPITDKETPERTGRLGAPDQPRGRSASAQPPTSRDAELGVGVLAKPHDATAHAQPGNQSPSRKPEKLRRTLLPGGRSRSNSHEPGSRNLEAWVISPMDTENSGVEYNTSLLVRGEKVPELWNDTANICVNLYPPDSGFGPSFKIPSTAITSSLIFTELAQNSFGQGKGFGSRDRLSVDDATRPRSGSPPISPTAGSDSVLEYHLYIPSPVPDRPDSHGVVVPLERLISIRNLFAFLTGQPLVGTKLHPTPFAIFLQISKLLEEFAFTSHDGLSFGQEVDLSFGFYIRQIGLGDVRNSREKTVEALVLGERMRSAELYNEAFTHAVGKYSAIIDLKSPLFNTVSRQTRQRLDRAHLDLLNRQHNVNVRLEQFDFPSLFAGVANSTSLTEFRNVRFKHWKTAFTRMKHFTLSYYKTVFGSWPPKASSRKNPFSESGLNRLVLKALYSDMCALYDLLADRQALTPRVIDQGVYDMKEGDDPVITALRRMLSEFDNSSPPVLPPIPFDVPMLPTMTSILETYDKMTPKEQSKFDKKVKGNELKLVLEKSYDYQTNTLNRNNPFLAEFKEFEAKEGKGKPAADLADQRVGYWLFLYVVIQSLPILVMDAPGLMFTDGVEYFLCEPPMGNPPWAEDGSQVRKLWYEVSGGAGYVELSADAVLFSVEAIHHRSHCWLSAKAWEAALQGGQPQLPVPGPPPTGEESSGISSAAAAIAAMDSRAGTPSTLSVDTSPSPGISGSPVIRPRNQSPGPRQLPIRAINSNHRSSIVFGIEPVFDLPEGLTLPGDRSSRVVSHDRGSSLNLAGTSSFNSHRSSSVGNLSALSSVHNSTPGPESPSVQGGATFDDILGKKDENDKKKKRKTFFFA